MFDDDPPAAITPSPLALINSFPRLLSDAMRGQGGGREGGRGEEGSRLDLQFYTNGVTDGRGEEKDES